MATVATTAAELAAAAGSFYNQTMALAELDLSPKYALPPKPRIAVVGTPCEIQGIRAMQARRWATGAHRIDSIVLTIALMCTKSFDFTRGSSCASCATIGGGSTSTGSSKIDVIHSNT